MGSGLQASDFSYCSLWHQHFYMWICMCFLKRRKQCQAKDSMQGGWWAEKEEFWSEVKDLMQFLTLLGTLDKSHNCSGLELTHLSKKHVGWIIPKGLSSTEISVLRVMRLFCVCKSILSIWSYHLLSEQHNKPQPLSLLVLCVNRSGMIHTWQSCGDETSVDMSRSGL